MHLDNNNFARLSGIPVSRPTQQLIVRHFHDVDQRLEGYERFAGLKSGTFIKRFYKSPQLYSLDVNAAIGSDTTRLAQAISGGKNTVSAPSSRTFGFVYLHVGVVVPEENKSNYVPKRCTIHQFDMKWAESVGAELTMHLIDCFIKLAKFSNHDPLHSILGDNQPFRGVDQHLRYGGVEFAPIVFHAAYSQNLVQTKTKVMNGLTGNISEYLKLCNEIPINSDSINNGLNHRLYAASLVLRHLLLVFPENHCIVKDFLTKTQSELFENRSVQVNAMPYNKFLKRDFSDGNEPDEIKLDAPMHVNRVAPYNHGKNSLLGPWLKSYLAQSFGDDCSKDVVMPMSTMLLLNTLKRGHGIFAVTSAITQAEHSQVVNQCIELFKDFSNTYRLNTATLPRF